MTNMELTREEELKAAELLMKYFEWDYKSTTPGLVNYMMEIQTYFNDVYGSTFKGVVKH